MRHFATAIILSFILGGAVFGQTVRIKDISTIEGVRPNQIMGYGLIVGLDGSGDSQQTKFTTQTMANMLQSYGISVTAGTLKIKNVAAVMVTATLPPFARSGTTIDVVVSSLGDAKSLQGGTLLQTPLRAANGEVYAVAQGPVSIGGFTGGGGGSSVSKNHATAGRVPEGAIIEKETKTDIAPGDILSITLNRNDFTTASRAANAIDDEMGGHYATAVDGNTISVSVPVEYKSDIVAFIRRIEGAQVAADMVAKVIVNERTGTVVIGGSAKISAVAVSHGALVVEITSGVAVSQPAPVSTGTTVVAPTTTTTVKEQESRLIQIDGATIEELVRALNALKVTPRDLIAILQAIKQAGALQAQLEVI